MWYGRVYGLVNVFKVENSVSSEATFCVPDALVTECNSFYMPYEYLCQNHKMKRPRRPLTATTQPAISVHSQFKIDLQVHQLGIPYATLRTNSF